MPAQALAAIVYFQLDGVLYEHTIDPRDVDAIFLQKDIRARVAAALPLEPPIGPNLADFRKLVGGAARIQLQCEPVPTAIRPLGLLPDLDGPGNLAALRYRFRMVPRNARDLLHLPPHPDASGGCRHCLSCITWCPPE